jgi:hypothetical protein
MSIFGSEEPCPVMASPVGEMGLGDVSSVCVAASGRMIALGTDSGGVVQMHLQHIVTSEEENDAGVAMDRNAVSYAVGVGTIAGNALEPVINLKSDPVAIPSYPAPPVPKHVSVDDPAVSTSYTLLRHSHSHSLKPLASSFSSTPKMFNTRLRVPTTRR